MAELEEQAIQELVQNIVQRGDGKVWMDGWRPRFVSLGPTPKDFMEQRPDLFQLEYRGKSFSVELIGEGAEMAKDLGAEAGILKGGKGHFAKGGSDESAVPQRGGPKGGISLAEPLKGKGMMGGPMGGFKGGPKGGLVLAAPKGDAYGKGQAYGKGGDWGGDAYGPPKGYGKMGYDAYGPPKGGGKWGNKGAGFAALPSPDQTGELADLAIAEIKEQLAARGEPKVWIEDWRERYKPLGPSPKQFLEARPDVFRLVYSPSGKGYSVYLAEEEEGGFGGGGGGFAGFEAAPPPQRKGYGKSAGYGKSGGGAAPQAQDAVFGGELDAPIDNVEDEQSCVDEITRLVRASPDGRICILNWFKRFAHLAKSPRAFMESRPDKFVLTLTGATYSVGLKEEAAASKAQPAKRQLPMMITARPRPVKVPRLDPDAPRAPAIGAASHNANPRAWTGPKAPSGAPPVPFRPAAAISPAENVLDFLGDKEEDALAEIFDQLSKPTCNGKVNFPNWVQRFGHLASNPREFIESHPDKFEIIPGPGASFTVELC